MLSLLYNNFKSLPSFLEEEALFVYFEQKETLPLNGRVLWPARRDSNPRPSESESAALSGLRYERKRCVGIFFYYSIVQEKIQVVFCAIFEGLCQFSLLKKDAPKFAQSDP